MWQFKFECFMLKEAGSEHRDSAVSSIKDKNQELEILSQ